MSKVFDKEEILKLIPCSDKIDYIYLAGSIMEGFGNDASDIDVFVISENPDRLAYEPTNFTREVNIQVGESFIKNIVIDSIRYDFEYYRSSSFTSLIEKLNNLNFNTENYIPRFTADEIDLLHRLKFAEPLLNKSAFNTILNNINFENLNNYLVITNIESYDGHLEDLQGALSCSDFGTSFVLLKLLLKYSLNAYLAKYGETNPGEKWLFRKLSRYAEKHGDQHLLDKYLNLLCYPFEKDKIKHYAQKTINFTQPLIIKAQK
ncbi:nucleotidyltransferase domain-containing protein [Bacillus stercoris]|uniref:nucleotidyltransferase domain-containing protein n=1 Tax=Bacillus stercoris TaxID=2054641 RepID=UPI000C9F81C1|nr:nucleotidyltransferase domain-containing protein [Bacillus stercoris]AUS11636.1 hypothetical protein C0W65_06130 [Bacillus subtilis]MDO7344967.1 nucleotidyltransferase domain-containing protein [Bacillus stercoris]TII16836.1 hypothetical protein C6Y43_02325 [Bacillus subtilis]BEV40013.1 hypothetical protein BSB_30860 [Bacillus stercoris]